MVSALSISRIVAGIAFLLWLINFTGTAYDMSAGTGANSLTYVSALDDGTLKIHGFVDGGTNLQSLRLGDIVVSIGDEPRNKLPDSQIGFRFAIAHADGVMTIRRGEETLQIKLALERYGFPIARLIRDLFLGLLAIGILVFGPRHPVTFVISGTLFSLSVVTALGAPIGPTPEAAGLLVASYCLSAGLFVPLTINMCKLIADLPGWSQALWPWVFAVEGCFTLMMFLGGPVPPPYGFLVHSLMLLVAGLWALSIIGNGLRHTTSRRVRLQLSWILLGASIFLISIVLAWLAIWVTDSQTGRTWYGLALNWATLTVPVAIVIAVLKADLAEIDRTAVLTATWAIVVSALALMFEFVLQPSVGFVAASIGLEESAGQTILVVAGALSAPSLRQRIQPFVDTLLCPLPEESS